MRRCWMTLLMIVAGTFALAACGTGGTSEEEPAAEDAAMEDGAEDGAEEAAEDGGEPDAAAEQEPEPAEDEEPAQTDAAGGILAEVQARGTLSCGVNDQLPGFGFVNAEGEFEGFDVDFCRAIAAAVLGDAEAVSFVPLSAQQRFTALQTGEVDVLMRNTTWTTSRDTQNGLDFGPTTFYDGQGMLVPSNLGVSSIAELDGANICVGSGTTTEKNLGDVMRSLGVDYTPVTFDGADPVFGAYDEGRCDAVTSDRSQLVSRRTTLAEPDAHVILDEVMSKEPLGPAYLQNDAAWGDVVNWVVYGVIAAEEMGIDSTNVAEMEESDSPEVRRMLGTEDALGEGLGLDADFLVTVIETVGNYGEIYERNLGPDTTFDLPRNGPNRQWTEGGLLYAPPFR